ncbi:hypothetical protein ACQKWADRAFT_325108 [Trichoderma austrokoningii]
MSAAISIPSIPYTRDDYTVGWVCALPKELRAAIYMFDERHPALKQPRGDSNAYVLGKMGDHNVVIASLPKGVTGTASSATVAAKMISSFPNIKVGLMVGIGSGIPQKVRLGEVVISAPAEDWPGVIQWDMGRAEDKGFIQTGSLNPPAKILLCALSKFEAEQTEVHADMMKYLDNRVSKDYFKSPQPKDVAYESTYLHVGGNDCSKCDDSMAMERGLSERHGLHYGLVASGNQVIKSAEQRDKLYRKFDENILCIETEAAGLMNDFPCIVIRGISDYADSHTNLAWEEYAAAAAAACAKTFLDVVPVNEVDKLEAVKSLLPPGGVIERTVASFFSYWFSSTSENTSSGSTDLKKTKDTSSVSEAQSVRRPPSPAIEDIKPSNSNPHYEPEHIDNSDRALKPAAQPPLQGNTTPLQYDGTADCPSQNTFSQSPNWGYGHTQGNPMGRIRNGAGTWASAKVTHRHALGQIAAIGSLYDARKDQILPQSAFSEPLYTDIIKQDRTSLKECEIEKSSSLMAAFEQLGLSPGLGLNYLTGTGPYTSKGSAGHLAQKRTCDAAQEVSVVCKEVTMHETLGSNMGDLKNIVDEDALQAEEATHIITGVWWGARTAITCIASPVGFTADAKATEAQLVSQELVIEHLGQLLTEKITSTYTIGYPEIAKGLTFRVNADIDPDKLSTRISDFNGVCAFIDKIPDTIKGTKTGDGVRIMYDLVPIKDFARIMDLGFEEEVQVVQLIEQEYQNRALFLFEKLYTARVSLNRYLKDLSHHELSVPQQHIETMKTKIFQLDDLEDRLKSELGQDLLRARDTSSKGMHKLNNPQWETDIEEFETLVSQYATKMAFESDITALGIRYMHPADAEASYSEHESEVYTLLYDDAALVAPNWKDQYAKFMELAYAKNSEYLLYVVDCDFQADQELRAPRIELRENGGIVTNDFVAEQQCFAGKCFVRAATPTDVEKLPAKLPDSIRRSVKIRCPCEATTVGDCFCRTCKEAVFFLEEDNYIYCSCGRYRPSSAALKCLDPAHGTRYLTYEDSESLQEAFESREFEQHNILILGETGIGKSTFINAFMIYMRFKTLDDAMEALDLHWAIPSSFQYTEMNDMQLETFTVTVGEETETQKYSLDGESGTRSCVTYVLHTDGLTLRLIDTPGIGDTRGPQQDKENVKDILQTLESIGKISTILLLIKPNLSRLGQAFDSCMTEMLSHFHKEANQTIVFGFTSSRSTNYLLGDTGIPLQKFLEDKKIDIAVDRDNTFFFDSEGFRYLAAYKTTSREMKDKINFEKSFRNSAEEARRLVSKTKRMAPHEVQKTWRLSDTRLCIERLQNVMILIKRIADEVQEEIEKRKSQIMELKTSNSALEDKLKMTIQKSVKKMLPSPRTVCTDNECRTVNRDTDDQEHIVYKRICHDYCYIKTTDELVGAPEISTCEVFDFSSKPCRECGHVWDKHQHISYTLTVEEVKVDDPAVLKIYNSNNSELEKAEAAIEPLLRKMEQLGEQREFIRRSLASCRAYLSSVSLVRHSDETINDPDYLIDNGNEEGSADGQQLEEQHGMYTEQCDEVTLGIPKLDLPSKVPSYTEIMEITRKLDQMEVGGSKIKDLGEEEMDSASSQCNAVTLSLEMLGKDDDSLP